MAYTHIVFIKRDIFDEKHYQSHEAYLQSWAKVLKDDSNELYRAASKVQEMANYLAKNMLLKGMALPPDRMKDELKRTAPQKEEMQNEELKGQSSGRQRASKCYDFITFACFFRED